MTIAIKSPLNPEITFHVDLENLIDDFIEENGNSPSVAQISLLLPKYVKAFKGTRRLRNQPLDPELAEIILFASAKIDDDPKYKATQQFNAAFDHLSKQRISAVDMLKHQLDKQSKVKPVKKRAKGFA